MSNESLPHKHLLCTPTPVYVSADPDMALLAPRAPSNSGNGQQTDDPDMALLAPSNSGNRQQTDDDVAAATG